MSKSDLAFIQTHSSFFPIFLDILKSLKQNKISNHPNINIYLGDIPEVTGEKFLTFCFSHTRGAGHHLPKGLKTVHNKLSFVSNGLSLQQRVEVVSSGHPDRVFSSEKALSIKQFVEAYCY
ncbi:hypothetical protein AB4491_05945 [Vibrio sp. 10N.261.45.A7]